MTNTGHFSLLHDTAPTKIYTLSLHDALPISGGASQPAAAAGLRGTIWYTAGGAGVADKLEVCVKSAGDTYSWVPVATPIDRKSTRLNSSHSSISYAVFCLKKK